MKSLSSMKQMIGRTTAKFKSFGRRRYLVPVVLLLAAGVAFSMTGDKKRPPGWGWNYFTLHYDTVPEPHEKIRITPLCVSRKTAQQVLKLGNFDKAQYTVTRVIRYGDDRGLYQQLGKHNHTKHFITTRQCALRLMKEYLDAKTFIKSPAADLNPELLMRWIDYAEWAYEEGEDIQYGPY